MGYPIFHSRFLLFLFSTYFCSRNFVIVLFAVVSVCGADCGALSVFVYSTWLSVMVCVCVRGAEFDDVCVCLSDVV